MRFLVASLVFLQVSSAFTAPYVHKGSLSSACRRWLSEDPFENLDNGPDEEADDLDEIDLQDADWRSFRARLVMTEKSESAEESTIENETSRETVETDEQDVDGIGAIFCNSLQESIHKMTPLDSTQWAYDTGKLIEQGAVILGGVEQDFGFGLRQQYFHKAAILILDHSPTFTKGILINRPTDLTLNDDINDIQWKVWYGGDVQNLASDRPDICCIHTLTDPRVLEASISVMNGIQWASFESAKKLVKAGYCRPQDFTVFCGYAGWGPGQLASELDRDSWYMVATDSQTLLQELAKLSQAADPRDAGIFTWDLLMNMIGRGETAEEYSGSFDDLMLKEWSRKHLLSAEAGGGAKNDSGLLPGTVRFKRSSGSRKVHEGTLLRASSNPRSPFLLDGQEYHKSLVLVLADDDEDYQIGAILNRPASRGLDVQISSKDGGESRVSLPMRFGGQYAVKGGEPLLWLHCKQSLRDYEVGNPVGSQKNGIYKCTAEQVIEAIGKGLAVPNDFLVVSGAAVWLRDEKGLESAVSRGDFEVVPEGRLGDVWSALSTQKVLAKTDLIQALATANEAWAAAGTDRLTEDMPAIGAIGERLDEEEDSYVYKSDVKVAKLSDDALRSWVATFMLDAPSLGA